MKKFKKIASIVLCAALILGLFAGCGSKEAPLSLEDQIKKDPAAYVTKANEKTTADLEARYAGSPIMIIKKSMADAKAYTATANIGITEDGSTMGVKAVLAADLATKKCSIEGSVDMGFLAIGGQLYAGTDFIGIKFPLFLGDDSFYGIQPTDVEAQLKGSDFAAMLGLDDATIKTIDEVLSKVSSIDLAALSGIEKDIKKLSDELLKKATFAVEKAENDAFKITATYSADTLKEYTEKVLGIIADNPAVKSLLGEALSKEMLDDAKQDAEAKDISIEYLIKDEKVLSYTTSEDDVKVVISFYDDNGKTVSVKADGEGGFTSTVDTADGYVHTINMDVKTTVITDDKFEESNVSVKLVSSLAKDGTYKAVITPEGEESLTVTAKLSAEDKKGFSLTEGTVTMAEETAPFSFSIECKPGAEIASPANTKNIFKMSQQELLGLLSVVGSLFD